MIDLLWFCLIAYGLTQILVFAKILDTVRPKRGKIGQLFKCPMCVGFWVGLFLWSTRHQTELFIFDNSLLTGLLLGFASSGSSYILNMIFGDEGIKIENTRSSHKEWRQKSEEEKFDETSNKD